MYLYPIYIADYDENLLEGIYKFVEKAFPKNPIHKFDHGLDLSNALMKEKKNSLILCDFNLEGLNGLQIAKKVKSESLIKDSYFLLLITPNDKELPLKAMQAGVDDIIYKPFSSDNLIIKLKQSSNYLGKLYEIDFLKDQIKQSKEKLAKSIDTQLDVLENFTLIKFDTKLNELRRIQKVTEFIAKHLSNDSELIKLIIKSTKLALINKLFIPEKFINTPVYSDGVVKIEAFEKIPAFIDSTFGQIEGMEPILNIINHTYENYDGSGFPSKLKGPEIPLGSRILRVVMDFEYINQKNNGRVIKTLEQLWDSMNKIYDFRIIAYYDQFLAAMNSKYINNTPPPEVKVTYQELIPGMILSRDIIVISGHKLIASATNLDESMVEKIQNAAYTESIIGNIYIRNIPKDS